MLVISRIKKTFFILLIFMTLPNPLIGKFHPDINWKEIKNKNFIIIYPESYEGRAHSISIKAADIYLKLSNLLDCKVKKKIRILISDFSDTFSSSSTIFPFYQIKINLAHPRPDRIYGSFKDHFNFFLSKEISKILMSSYKGGPINHFRKLFGNHPLLSPLLTTPSPFIEGFSTFFAFYINKDSETVPIELNLILSKIAESRRFPELSKLCGNYSEWPANHTKLIFGTGFILFLSENYITPILTSLIRSYAKEPFKYNIDSRIKHFLSEDLSILWENFYYKYKDKKNKFKMNKDLKQIDTAGMIQRYPLFINDKSVLLLKNNFIESKQFIIDNEIDDPLIFTKNDISGISFDKESKKLYYSATINTTPCYNFSDIFEYNLIENKKEQISYGERIYDPVRVSNTDTILCIKKKKENYYLAHFDLNTKKNKIISKGFISMANPVISPDKKLIACAVKRELNNWQIALFDYDGNFIKFLTYGSKNSYYPKWKDDNTLFYISEYNKQLSLFSYEIIDEQYFLFDIQNAELLKYFSFSNNKDKVVLTYITENGYNTSYINFEDLIKNKTIITLKKTFEELENSKIKIADKFISKKTAKYNIFRDLVPKYFSFSFSYAGNEIQPGISTTGIDILGKNEYDLNVYYGFARKNLSYDLKYKYSGFYQNLKISTFDKYNLNTSMQGKEFMLRTIGTQVYISHPFFKTKNHTALIAFDLHFEKVIFEQSMDEYFENICDNCILDSHLYNGFALSLLYRSSKKHYSSISKNDGFHLSITFSKNFKFLGSTYNSNSLFFEYKHFIAILRPNVLTFRLAIFKSRGNHERGIFMGGAEAITTTDPLKNRFFGLMRGFPSGFFYGTSGYLLNSEYRISLLKIEDKILFLPYLERIYLTLFTDIGELITKTNFKKPSISYGAEFNLKFNFSNPLTLACGIAKGKNPDHNTIFYIRLENSF